MKTAIALTLTSLAACQSPPEIAADGGGGLPTADAGRIDAGGADAALGTPVLVGMWGGYGTEPGQFVEPSSVELDSQGFVYVAGHENRFQKFTRDGELVDIFGTAGAGDGQFNHPHGLAMDRARGDVLYIGDQENHRVQVFTVGGEFVRLWTDDQFEHIHDVGIDPASGEIYVGDYELHVLQKFTATGDLLFERGGPGTGPAQIAGIWGISTDSAGNVYIADTGNRRVQKLDRDGGYLREWSGCGAGGEFQKPPCSHEAKPTPRASWRSAPRRSPRPRRAAWRARPSPPDGRLMILEHDVRWRPARLRGESGGDDPPLSFALFAPERDPVTPLAIRSAKNIAWRAPRRCAEPRA